MAERMRKTHQDDVRAKIQASVIIQRLGAHINGDVELSATQVRAAEILLKKCVPDLSNVEHSGPDGGPMTVEVVRFDPKANA